MRIGHGQMRERELEQLMVDFYHRRFNILLCTTIIESGIDVPTANTIMINRADRFGLAQLHQLRGRVGRSHHRAYAYLIVPPRKQLTADAIKRLDAIESLENLGAGFVLATHDLEIRGAGELLGESQSGELSEVGLAMFLDMLERAVDALKEGREPQLDRPLAASTEVELHVPAFLPNDYVADVHIRLGLYKRIAAADASGLDELTAELVDRFGELPAAAGNLLKLARLKLRARELGVRSLNLGTGGGHVLFEEKKCSRSGGHHPPDPEIPQGAAPGRFTETAGYSAARRRREALRLYPGSAAALQRPERVIRFAYETARLRLRHLPVLVSAGRQQPGTTGRTGHRRGAATRALIRRRRRPLPGLRSTTSKSLSFAPMPRSALPRIGSSEAAQAPAVPVAAEGEIGAPVADAAAPAPGARFIRALTPAEFQLGDLEARIKASGAYVAVAHLGWAQTASPWGSRESMSLQQLGFDNPLLAGTITLERGQFLHLGFALNLTVTTPPAGLGAAPNTTFVLNDNHRVKFYERNYYDSPAFGVIALVVPAQGARRAGR